MREKKRGGKWKGSALEAKERRHVTERGQKGKTETKVQIFSEWSS